MNKPIVFFSHSSCNKQILLKLKEILGSKLGGTVEIFLSSDGESIPFGTNWVHEIQEALKKAKVMFIFLSPQSIRSGWIHFEAGYAYSPGNVRVIPIGILGFDIAKLSPPLSLLQGFTITSVESLNNIIAILNNINCTKHTNYFTHEEYMEIFDIEAIRTTSLFGKYTSIVEDVIFKIQKADNPNLTDIVKNVTNKSTLNFQSNLYQFQSNGITIEVCGNNVKMKCDPYLSALTFPIVEQIIIDVEGSSFTGYHFDLYFVPNITILKGDHRISAKLFDTEVKIGDNFDYVFRDIHFTFKNDSVFTRQRGKYIVHSDKKYLRVISLSRDLIRIALTDLLNILFERNVLFFNTDN